MIPIRGATAADIDTLLRLNAVVQRWHAEAYPEYFRPDPDPEEMTTFFTDVQKSEDCHLRITDDGSGYLFARVHTAAETFYGRKPARLHIEHIAVLPDRQRAGIGHALMADAERLARDLNCTRITLDTWEANTGAHRLFEACGMVPRRKFYDKPLD